MVGRRIGSWSILALTLLLAACTQTGTNPPQQADLASIVVTPDTILLTGDGDSFALSGAGFDTDGEPLEVNLRWESLTPAALSIDEDGTVTSLTELGSGQVIAKARGVQSAPVFVLIAQPVPDTVLIDDDDVVAGPFVEAGSKLELGLQYRIELSGVPAPPDGVILMTRGERAIGGRVVSSTPQGNRVEVTLEIVTPEEMFEALLIDEELDMSNAELEIPDTLGDAFAVRRLEDGSYEASSDPNATWTFDESLQAQQVQGTQALGPYECTTTSTFPNVTLTGAQFSQTNSLSLDFRYDSANGGLQRLVAQGDVKIEVKSSLVFNAAYEGKLTCTGEIFQFTIPIGGPLALIFGGHVPIGAGIEYAGKITVAQAGVEVKATTQHTVQIGIDCSGGPSCSMVNSYTPNNTGEFKPIIPNPGSQFRLEYSMFGFGFIDLALGNRFIKFLRFQAFTIRGGLKQSFNFAPMNVQMNDATYASDFKLELEFSAGTGRAINRLLGLLQINLVKLELKDTVLLASSPTGTLDINTSHNHSSPTHVRPSSMSGSGDEAEFVVNLNGRTYLGIDVVESITIRRKENGEAVALDGSCEQVTGSGTSFTCLSPFAEDQTGKNEVYAFIDLKLFGVSLPIVLEVKKDSHVDIEVDPEPEITGNVTKNTNTIPAESNVPVTFTIPFEDKGENITGISARFELAGNPNVFTFDWTLGDPNVTGFTGASGNGTASTSIFIFCSEEDKNPVTVTVTLTDELEHVSVEKETTLTVNYSGC